jgi:hypothetical protein
VYGLILPHACPPLPYSESAWYSTVRLDIGGLVGGYGSFQRAFLGIITAYLFGYYYYVVFWG